MGCLGDGLNWARKWKEVERGEDGPEGARPACKKIPFCFPEFGKERKIREKMRGEQEREGGHFINPRFNLQNKRELAKFFFVIEHKICKVIGCMMMQKEKQTNLIWGKTPGCYNRHH